MTINSSPVELLSVCFVECWLTFEWFIYEMSEWLWDERWPIYFFHEKFFFNSLKLKIDLFLNICTILSVGLSILSLCLENSLSHYLCDLVWRCSGRLFARDVVKIPERGVGLSCLTSPTKTLTARVVTSHKWYQERSRSAKKRFFERPHSANSELPEHGLYLAETPIPIGINVGNVLIVSSSMPNAEFIPK